MTEYVCTRHGDIADDVLDTEMLFDVMHNPTARKTGDDGHLHAMAYPKQRYICARCLKALIDDHFAPLRVKG